MLEVDETNRQTAKAESEPAPENLEKPFVYESRVDPAFLVCFPYFEAVLLSCVLNVHVFSEIPSGF